MAVVGTEVVWVGSPAAVVRLAAATRQAAMHVEGRVACQTVAWAPPRTIPHKPTADTPTSEPTAGLSTAAAAAAEEEEEGAGAVVALVVDAVGAWAVTQPCFITLRVRCRCRICPPHRE